jgi:hypothetical protein
MLDWRFAKSAAALLSAVAIGCGTSAMAQDADPGTTDGYVCECPNTAQAYGPNTADGYGPDMAQEDSAQEDSAQGDSAQTDLNLTVDAVKKDVERWLEDRGNPRLKVGEVKEKDDDTIEAEIVTLDNSLVERYAIDRHSGAYRADHGAVSQDL